MPPLINATQLDAWRHSDTPPRILDASWHPPTAGRLAHQAFLQSHIPDAAFFDQNLFCDAASPLPNTLSGDIHTVKRQFETLGIHAGQSVVLYDQSEVRSAARAYWICRVWGFPADFLHILDGGFQSWQRKGFITASGHHPLPLSALATTFQPQLLTTLSQMKKHLAAPCAQVVDLRHPVRFAGGPEPRAGVRAGHIPGSFCFPWFSCFSADGLFLSFEKLSQRLRDIGVDPEGPLITTCGSGITATLLNFVLDNLSHRQHSLYDGSWAEWGASQCLAGESSLLERPVETCLDEGLMPHPA